MHTLLDCAAISRALSMYRMASSTMSTRSTSCSRKLARSMSWIALMSISAGFMGCIWPEPSSSPAPNRTWTPIALFGADRPRDGRDLRSDHRTRWPLHQSQLSRTSAAHPLSRFRNRQNAGVSDQSLHSSGPHHRRPLQKSLARGAVLQVDQAASADQTILRNLGKRGEDPIWIAVSVYVLVAIIKKRLGLDASLYTLLQVLSVSLFEKIELKQALAENPNKPYTSQITNQLNLFAF